MKVQYPGVAKSIDTDVANITMILNRFNFLPRGLYADSAIRTAKKELKWECDYEREAAYAEKFARLLANDPIFIVPKVFRELTTKKVYTTEYFDGLVLDDCVSLPQDTRNWVSLGGGEGGRASVDFFSPFHRSFFLFLDWRKYDAPLSY